MTSNQASRSVGTPTIVVIEERTLFRDCFIQSLSSITDNAFLGVASVEQWESLSKSHTAALFVLCNSDERKHEQEFARLMEIRGDAPAVVVSHAGELGSIVQALKAGATGYITTSMTIDAAVAAINFVGAGGVFVPAESLLSSARQSSEGVSAVKAQANSIFTARQAAVVEALRRGKANKLIAHELNMCESTVKVHVRKIMRKLKATNRTQVAFMTNELLSRESLGSATR